MHATASLTAEWAAGAVQEHVVVPLVNVRDDLFRTLRNRRSIVSVEEFEADKASLLRMLAEFQADLQVCVCV